MKIAFNCVSNIGLLYITIYRLLRQFAASHGQVLYCSYGVTTINDAKKYLKKQPNSHGEHWDVHLNDRGMENQYYGIQRALLHVVVKHIRGPSAECHQGCFGDKKKKRGQKRK